MNLILQAFIWITTIAGWLQLPSGLNQVSKKIAYDMGEDDDYFANYINVFFVIQILVSIASWWLNISIWEYFSALGALTITHDAYSQAIVKFKEEEKIKALLASTIAVGFHIYLIIIVGKIIY